MNEYDLINSKTIGEHCRNIGHRFNTEELAVLIYRNKAMDIVEKIDAYTELIEKYADMPVIRHLHCGPYESVKECIEKEIERLNNVYGKLKTFDEDGYYKLGAYYITSGRFDNSSLIPCSHSSVVSHHNNWRKGNSI